MWARATLIGKKQTNKQKNTKLEFAIEAAIHADVNRAFQKKREGPQKGYALLICIKLEGL